MNEENKIAECLINDGFREFNDSFNKYTDGFIKRSFQKRLTGFDDYLCLCNDKLFLNATINTVSINDYKQVSVDIELTHENTDNLWFDLRCYSISADELLQGKDVIYQKLIDAWKAVY